jgi:hypothetical protein
MKTKPRNQQPIKSPKNTQTVDAVDPVMRKIITQFPSMAAGKAMACALKVYSHRTGKIVSAAAMDKLIPEVVMEYATGFVTNYGKVFVEGRKHTTAQVLLRIWSMPDNELEVARFLKMLKQGRQAYENL